MKTPRRGRKRLQAPVKRLMDVTLASAGLLVASPAMLAIAVAVRLTSPGPALFRQQRVGRDGVAFTLYKFRSMESDAEAGTGPVWARADDPRATPLGRLLRRTRLDELPQLWNVLAGDMSLVGPRPERPVFVEELERKIPGYRRRQAVKPGLTGWAQVNHPYASSVEEAHKKLEYDLFYIEHQTLGFDLSILAATLKIVFRSQGT